MTYDGHAFAKLPCFEPERAQGPDPPLMGLQKLRRRETQPPVRGVSADRPKDRSLKSKFQEDITSSGDLTGEWLAIRRMNDHLAVFSHADALRAHARNVLDR